MAFSSDKAKSRTAPLSETGARAPVRSKILAGSSDTFVILYSWVLSRRYGRDPRFCRQIGDLDKIGTVLADESFRVHRLYFVSSLLHHSRELEKRDNVFYCRRVGAGKPVERLETALLFLYKIERSKDAEMF